MTPPVWPDEYGQRRLIFDVPRELSKCCREDRTAECHLGNVTLNNISQV